MYPGAMTSGGRPRDDLPRYRFASLWRVAALPDDAFTALLDVPSYPAWWPQVKRVRQVPGRRYEVTMRSVLPITLTVELEQVAVDRAGGLLDARLTGDLDGRARWTIETTPVGSELRFDEDVVTTRPLMNALAPVARAAFVANHWLMMRAGERGLRVLLAGYRLGREPPPDAAR